MLVTTLTMKNKTSLSEQTFYLVLGRCLAFSLALLHPIILVRIFTKDEYGSYRQLLLIFSTIYPLGEMGITQGLFYFLPREPGKKDAVITQTLFFVVSLSTVLCGFLLIFKSAIASAFHNMEITPYIPLLGVYIFLMINSSFLETSMIAESRIKLASVVILVSQAIQSGAIIITAFLTRDILFVFYALILFSGVRFVFQCLYLVKTYRLSMKTIELGFWKRQLAYSIPIGLSNVAWLLQEKLHSYFISFLFNAKMFAIYFIGTYNLPFVGIIAASVSNVMMPELSRCEKKGQKIEILRIWNNAIRKMNLVFFPIFVFFSLMADDFIAALFTINYTESVPIFRISLLAILISGINTGAVLNAYAETKYLMKIAFLRLPVAIITLYIFTSIWGVLGTISGNVVVIISFRFLVLAKVSKVMNVPFCKIIEWKKNARILLVAIASGIPSILIKNFTTFQPIVLLVITFLLYITCYGLFSITFGILSRQEIMDFKKYLLDKLDIGKAT